MSSQSIEKFGEKMDGAFVNTIKVVSGRFDK